MNNHATVLLIMLVLLVAKSPSAAGYQQTGDTARPVFEPTAKLLRRQLRERRREAAFVQARLQELAAHYCCWRRAWVATAASDASQDLPEQEVNAFFAARQQRLRNRLVEVNDEIRRIQSRLKATPDSLPVKPEQGK
jgi:hypothetical protein